MTRDKQLLHRLPDFEGHPTPNSNKKMGFAHAYSDVALHMTEQFCQHLAE
jgi:hypothetical protein